MKYEKPALSFEQQADLLLARVLLADKEQLVFSVSDDAWKYFLFANASDQLPPK